MKTVNEDALITIALPKGRIFEEANALLLQAGIVLSEHPDHSRKLIFTTNHDHIKVVIVRATDVPTYVRYGAADIGIAGKDILLEQGLQNLFICKDLDMAKCRLSVACPADFDYPAALKKGRLSVATKYTECAARYFSKLGIHIDLVKLYGSMELAPLVGLADVIVDLVSTGSTLKANRLVEVAHIMDIHSQLVCNAASHKNKSAQLRSLIHILSEKSL